MCFAPQRRALFRHFFDIWTSKSGPRMVCFVHFDLEMCFAPQRRALFRHRNFKKWSDHGVFCTFWLGNVLRATTACTFFDTQLPKVVRAWCVLYILTSKCASRHNGVHFFDIATSKSGPTLVCFVHFDFKMCFAPQRRALFRHRNFQKWSEHGVFCTFWLGNVLRATTACTFSSLIWPAGSAPAALASLLFDPPEPQIIGKTQWIATFSVSRRSYLFAHLHLLSSDLFSSDSSHLCFSTVHIVGSFTSKLPSIIMHHPSSHLHDFYLTFTHRKSLDSLRCISHRGQPWVDSSSPRRVWFFSHHFRERTSHNYWLRTFTLEAENLDPQSSFSNSNNMGMSENGVYPQWNSHLVGIMIRQTHMIFLQKHGTVRMKTAVRSHLWGPKMALGTSLLSHCPSLQVTKNEYHPLPSSSWQSWSPSWWWFW